MGGICCEAPNFLKRSLEPRDHGVESTSKVAELVIGVGLCQAAIQPGRGDFSGGGDHSIYRRERLRANQ